MGISAIFLRFRIPRSDTSRSTSVLTSMTFSVTATSAKSYSRSTRPSICLVGRGHGFSSTQAGPRNGATAIEKSTGTSTALLCFSADRQLSFSKNTIEPPDQNDSVGLELGFGIRLFSKFCLSHDRLTNRGHLPPFLS